MAFYRSVQTLPASRCGHAASGSTASGTTGSKFASGSASPSPTPVEPALRRRQRVRGMGRPAAGGHWGLRRMFLKLGHRAGPTTTYNIWSAHADDRPVVGQAAAGPVSSGSNASGAKRAPNHPAGPMWSGVIDRDQRASIGKLSLLFLPKLLLMNLALWRRVPCRRDPSAQIMILGPKRAENSRARRPQTDLIPRYWPSSPPLRALTPGAIIVYRCKTPRRPRKRTGPKSWSADEQV